MLSQACKIVGKRVNHFLICTNACKKKLSLFSPFHIEIDIIAQNDENLESNLSSSKFYREISQGVVANSKLGRKS